MLLLAQSNPFRTDLMTWNDKNFVNNSYCNFNMSCSKIRKLLFWTSFSWSLGFIDFFRVGAWATGSSQHRNHVSVCLYVHVLKRANLCSHWWPRSLLEEWHRHKRARFIHRDWCSSCPHPCATREGYRKTKNCLELLLRPRTGKTSA